MNEHYILDGHEPVAVSLLTWAKWFETVDRHVAKDVLNNGVTVSTVFLGLDHSFGEGPPLLFETMSFPKDSWSEKRMGRYSTWAEAEAGHAAILAEEMAEEESDGEAHDEENKGA